MANIGEKAISILAGNSNSSLSYLNTTIPYDLIIDDMYLSGSFENIARLKY